MWLMAALGLLLNTAAVAHEWYPTACCSGRDCHEIPPNAVRKVKGGWLIIFTGEMVKDEDVRESNDGNYHRCWNPANSRQTTIIADKQPCLWVPFQAGY